MDSDGIYYILLVILVAFSAFFSSSETAFSSINKIRIGAMASHGDKKAQKVLKIAEDYDRTLSAILIGNNVVNIASASVATVLFTKIFGQETGAIVSTLVMTLVVLTFGEIIPKSIAKSHADRLAFTVSGPLSVIISALKPLVSLFVKLTDYIKKLTKHSDRPTVTEEELKSIIESIEEEGILKEAESELICSALEFDDIMVQEILTPRVDIIAVDVNESIDNIIDKIEQEGYSRIPVYNKSIDKIVGFVRSRDVLINRLKSNEQSIKGIIQECLFIHKTMKISQLMDLFQSKNTHMAIVSDDYGGTMGLVTMEDVLEQLVGEIWDEYDKITPDYIKIEENKYEVSGDMNVYDLFELLEIDDKELEEESASNSVGGWVVEVLEHIPNIGESFDYKCINVYVDEVDEKRVIKLIVQKTIIDDDDE